MKSFRNYCSTLIVEQQLSLMAKEIAENDYDLEVILEGAFETLIKADPEKAEILLEQQRSFMHSLGSGARKVGQWFSGLGQDFMAGMRGEPLVKKALDNFLQTAQQANYHPDLIKQAIEQHLDQQRGQGYGPQAAGGEVPVEPELEPEAGAPAPAAGAPAPAARPVGPTPGVGVVGGDTTAARRAAAAQARKRQQPRAPFGPMPG